MGRALGVIHASGPLTAPPTANEVSSLTTLAAQAASRIGTVRAFQKSQAQATTDGLTGLANRRAIEELTRSLTAAGRPYSVVLADLDHFKRLNDTFGHDAGDAALRVFARTLRSICRADDTVGRWGGEEFVLVLPDATAPQALEVCQRIRTGLAEALRATGGPMFTTSFGIADGSMGRGLEDLLKRADQALYASKDAGRDRATIASARTDLASSRHESEHRAEIDIPRLVDSLQA